MRKAINDNPIAQIGLIGLLAVVVGFLFLTRVMKSDDSAEAPATTDASAVPAGTPAPATTPEAGAAAVPVTPADDATTVPVTPESGAPVPAGDTEFAAGPGLPGPLVDAYDRGDTVVLYVTRYQGVDDRAVTQNVRRLNGVSEVSLFETNAKDIADYSRIAAGVDVDRTPALVVLTPRDVTGPGQPVATVSYGFRGFDSVAQAVRDAGYDGKDLPYSP